MDRERFQQLVEEALAEIPAPFLERLENVEILVEDEPDAVLLREMGLNPRVDTLFGLYQGVPLAARGDHHDPVLPDRITLYYRPLVHACRTPRALRREIRDTLIHEIAHFLGMDEDEVEQEGY